jgi:hypothetical protein
MPAQPLVPMSRSRQPSASPNPAQRHVNQRDHRVHRESQGFSAPACRPADTAAVAPKIERWSKVAPMAPGINRFGAGFFSR